MLSSVLHRSFSIPWISAPAFGPMQATTKTPPSQTTAPLLGDRYTDAMIYAAQLHRYQIRKNGGTPYISHLQAVSALVLRSGGSEDEAIAAWLHDAVEDQGGFNTLQAIRSRFGDNVADIVKGCSDCFTEPTPPLPKRISSWWKEHSAKTGFFKTSGQFLTEFSEGLKNKLSGKGELFPEKRPSWGSRKIAYLNYLSKEASIPVLMVSACDKLDNARSVLQEYREHEEALWDQFSGGKGMIEYWEKVLTIYEKRGLSMPVTDDLKRVVTELKQLVETKTGQPANLNQFFSGIES